jgi:hypothetical protein
MTLEAKASSSDSTTIMLNREGLRDACPFFRRCFDGGVDPVETATRYSLAMVLFMAAAISTATSKEGSKLHDVAVSRCVVVERDS